jgi:tetratricopeptide (TPR) repeat protein
MAVHRLLLLIRSSPALWIFLLGFAVRLTVLLRFSDSIHFLPEGDDMKFYSDWAQRIAGGTLTDHHAFYGLPGYAYLLAPFFWVFGGWENPEFIVGVVVGLLQCAADAGIAVLLFQISRLIFRKDAAAAEEPWPPNADFIGFAAALLWIAFIPAQTFSVILMPTVWLLFSFYLCLYWLVKTEASTWSKPWLWLGLFCGVAAMLVATILFLIPLMLVSIFLTVNRGQSWASRAPKITGAVLALVAGIFVGASPAWIHNHFIAREPVMLSAHSGINFWIGNNPTATGYPKMPPGIRSTQEGLLQDSIRLAEEASGRPMRRFEVSKFWSERASAYISGERLAWLRLLRTKFANFWNAYQYDDLSVIKLLRDDGVLLAGFRFGWIAAFGLAGFGVILRHPRARWIAAAVVLHMAAVLTVFVTERYRLAAVPGLMLLGSAGLWSFWSDLVRARWIPAGGYMTTALAASWFVSIPQSDIGLWSLDHYKAGIRAIAAGDLDRAQTNLETAFAYVQENADINFALGNLWLERANLAKDAGEQATHRTRAKLFYRRALDLNPRHASTLNNLGVLAFEEKRFDLAERFLVESLAIESGAAKTYYLLAQVRLSAGKLDEARAALHDALRLQPKQKEFLELLHQITPSSSPAP